MLAFLRREVPVQWWWLVISAPNLKISRVWVRVRVGANSTQTMLPAILQVKKMMVIISGEALERKERKRRRKRVGKQIIWDQPQICPHLKAPPANRLVWQSMAVLIFRLHIRGVGGIRTMTVWLGPNRWPACKICPCQLPPKFKSKLRCEVGVTSTIGTSKMWSQQRSR